MAAAKRNYTRIVAMIYALLPYTLLKQKLFYRLRKAPAGLPSFICIGAQKAGTTWLYEKLRTHSEVCMAEPKEVHYFDWFFYRSLRWYLRHFSCSGKLRGEVTPGYSVIEQGRVRFMKRIMPGLKIILLLRDPRERAWSSARFHFGREQGRDLTTITNEEYIAHFNQPWVKQRGDYETIWKKWTSVFSKEQLLVLFAEDIAAKPQDVLQRVSGFLQVREFPAETANIRYNESENISMPVQIRKYLDEMYAPMISRLPSLMDEDFSSWKS
jgi:hypothetical protein